MSNVLGLDLKGSFAEDECSHQRQRSNSAPLANIFSFEDTLDLDKTNDSTSGYHPIVLTISDLSSIVSNPEEEFNAGSSSRNSAAEENKAHGPAEDGPAEEKKAQTTTGEIPILFGEPRGRMDSNSSTGDPPQRRSDEKSYGLESFSDGPLVNAYNILQPQPKSNN
jgi:hypothetical protein